MEFIILALKTRSGVSRCLFFEGVVEQGFDGASPTVSIRGGVPVSPAARLRGIPNGPWLRRPLETRESQVLGMNFAAPWLCGAPARNHGELRLDAPGSEGLPSGSGGFSPVPGGLAPGGGDVLGHPRKAGHSMDCGTANRPCNAALGGSRLALPGGRPGTLAAALWAASRSARHPAPGRASPCTHQGASSTSRCNKGQREPSPRGWTLRVFF